MDTDLRDLLQGINELNALLKDSPKDTTLAVKIRDLKLAINSFTHKLDDSQRAIWMMEALTDVNNKLTVLINEIQSMDDRLLGLETIVEQLIDQSNLEPIRWSFNATKQQ